MQRYVKYQKYIDGSWGIFERKVFGANIQISRKKKFQKCFFVNLKVENRKSKNEKRKNRDFCYIRVRVCAWKLKNWVYFQIYDAVKYRMMLFKPIFSPVERILWFFPYKLPQTKRKRLRTL